MRSRDHAGDAAHVAAARGVDRGATASARVARLLVFVPAGEASAGAERAHLLLGTAAESTTFTYRTRPGLLSALQLVWRALVVRPTIIYVLEATWLGVIVACLMKVLMKSRFVVDTGDAAYALVRSMGRVGWRSRALVRLLEQVALRGADLVVVRGRYHRLYLRDRGVANVVQIPDCVVTKPATDVAERAARLRTALGLDQVLTVGVLGSCIWSPRLGICYGWDLIEALALLRDLPIHGVIIGSGDGVPHLEQRVKALGLPNVTFLPSVPLDQVDEHVRLLDVCLSTQTDDLVGWVRTTGKLPLYLANERFVIATDVGEASWILPPIMRLTYHGVVDQVYPRRLAERLREIVLNPSFLEEAKVGPTRVRQHFDANHLASVLSGELSKLERGTSDAMLRTA